MSEIDDRSVRNLIVVSYNENGFWQADFYFEALNWTDMEWVGPVPDDYFTMKKGATKSQTVAKAHRVWPNTELRVADRSCT